MKLMGLFAGFALLVHVKCQLDVNVEDILYGEEEDEEYDEEGGTTARTSTTTTTVPTTSTTTTITTSTTTVPTTVVATLAANLTNTTSNNQNQTTFVLKPANGTFFGSVISVVGPATTERVQYVLGQVGNIWNNVGKLNITGIVDHALGIRNNYLARPLVTGILNVVFCNPVTFSDNNCRKRSKDGNRADNSTSQNTTVL